MPTTSSIAVKDLSLDLKNFRTTPQKKESDAIKAMIAIKPDRFFAVMESILDDGYLPTETIIVLKSGPDNIVKEGNRRIAILKLIHGIYKVKDFGIPDRTLERIKALPSSWKTDNASVPCTIFKASEAAKADRVVSLTHGKGDKASRDPWSAVAKARYNRDVMKASEPGLDLLEKYLKVGGNVTSQQKERWAGEYKVTILTEAMQKLHVRLGCTSAADLAQKYPKIPNLIEFESIIRDIGLEQLETRELREKDFEIAKYGFPALKTSPSTGSTSNSTSNATPASTTNNNSSSANTTPSPSSTSTTNTSGATTSSTPASSTSGATASTAATGPKAHPINDEKHVAKLLKDFAPRGSNRQKVVSLRNELKSLKIKDNPIAFCLLLRSIFEVSAKVFASEKSIATTKSNGKEKTLAELLTAIYTHITTTSTNAGMAKVLHGANVELSKTSGILSITSMNQLVHGTTFSIVPADICTTFGNVYPLLEAMN